MADLIASNTNTDGSGLTYWGSNARSGQTFTVPSGYTRLAYMQFVVRKVGTPGTYYGSFWNTSGGNPSSQISEGSLSEGSISTSYGWITLDPADATVTPGGTYAAVTRQPSSTGLSDAYYMDTATSGGGKRSTDAGSSWLDTANDWSYRIYAYGPPASLGATSTSSVGETSFYASSSVGNDMGATITERGFCYSTTDTTPDTGDSKKSVSSGEGSFGTTITGLAAGTTYYIRSYAINAAGTSYGAVKTQATTIDKPDVTTSAASSVDKFSATLNGEVTDDHGASVTERGFVYNTSGTPTTADTKAQDGTGVGVVSADLTGLTAVTTYYVRAYAINSEGTSYGGQITFTTLSAAPTVTTASVTNLLDTTVTLGGNVTADNGSVITERGVCYGLSINPTTANNKQAVAGTTGAYTKDVTGLSPATTYHTRAFATNAYGTSYGSDVEFTTEPTEPSAIVGTRTGKTTATISWTKGTGADTTVVRRDTGSYPSTPAGGSAVYSGTGVTVNDTGLSAGVTYYYRAWSLDGASNYSTDTDDVTVTTDYGLTNPANIYSDDSTYATAPAEDNKIYIRLSKDAGVTWQAPIEATLPASNAEVTFGEQDEELWGATWTGDDVDDTSFRMQILLGTSQGSYHTVKDFGFSITPTLVLTGIEVVVKGYFDTDTAYLDHVKMKIHYGTSVLPIAAGTQAYDSTTGKLAFYDGTQWKQVATV